MFFFPLIIGIVVAVILTYGVRMLRNKGFSQNTIYACTLIQTLIGVLFLVYGYKEVRGWDGFGYMQFGTPIILISLISFIMNISNPHKILSK